jgi:uncharacterized RmlC-like cupin family protein
MLRPIVTELNYTYKKPNTEVWVLNTDDIPIEKTRIKDQQVVYLGPQTVAGNHKHQRTEWFIAMGDLEIIWLGDNNTQHTKHMNPRGAILLIEVPPYLPHAVRNNSNTHSGILFEFSNAKMKDILPVQVA